MQGKSTSWSLEETRIIQLEVPISSGPLCIGVSCSLDFIKCEGPFGPLDPFELTHATYTLPGGDFGDNFHVFGLYWDNKTLYTYLDKDSQVGVKIMLLMYTESVVSQI